MIRSCRFLMLILLTATAQADEVASAIESARVSHRTAIQQAETRFLAAVDGAVKATAAEGDLEQVKALLAQKQAFVSYSGPITSPRARSAIRT